ncbi:MAG: SDR family NAD(P)-dependent oxidoreductase, partial [Victivallales bacterium]|nr:SDR family NAD(P)-dependent oxidoreductase [Victivallales bacterium]
MAMNLEVRLRNDSVLVFGGGSGIGKAIAQRLLMENARVTICGRSE